MVNFTLLLTMAAAVSAVHIDFKRYADDKCNSIHHIRKTSDLHATHCKSFSKHEVPFHAFSFDVTEHASDLDKKACRIVVYDGENCHGQSYSYGDMKPMNHVCAAMPAGFEGRSVKVECGKKKDPAVKILKPVPTPTSEIKQMTVTHKPTGTVTITQKIEPEAKEYTMTVVPKQHRVQSCHYDDDWQS